MAAWISMWYMGDIGVIWGDADVISRYIINITPHITKKTQNITPYHVRAAKIGGVIWPWYLWKYQWYLCIYQWYGVIFCCFLIYAKYQANIKKYHCNFWCFQISQISLNIDWYLVIFGWYGARYHVIFWWYLWYLGVIVSMIWGDIRDIWVIFRQNINELFSPVSRHITRYRVIWLIFREIRVIFEWYSAVTWATLFENLIGICPTNRNITVIWSGQC